MYLSIFYIGLHINEPVLCRNGYTILFLKAPIEGMLSADLGTNTKRIPLLCEGGGGGDIVPRSALMH